MTYPGQAIGRAIDDLTGKTYFTTDNGDPSGYSPDDDVNDPIAKEDSPITPTPAPVTPKTKDASVSPSWWDIAKNVLFDATNPKVVDAVLGNNVQTPPPPIKDDKKKWIWVIVGVVLVIVVLLYFAFKKEK